MDEDGHVYAKVPWNCPIINSISQEMAEEIRRCGGRSFFFGESNFGGNKARAEELLEALIPLKIRWSTLWSSQLCLDERFLDLARYEREVP